MEINITKFFNEACPKDYSASMAEIGQNAAMYTWQAALDDSADYLFLDDENKREEFRIYIAEFGAWDEKEIAAFSDCELNALCIQLISGDIREAGLDVDDKNCEEFESSENAGRIYKGNDGNIYYYVGN